jgi:hypothetical protein
MQYSVSTEPVSPAAEFLQPANSGITPDIIDNLNTKAYQHP